MSPCCERQRARRLCENAANCFTNTEGEGGVRPVKKKQQQAVNNSEFKPYNHPIHVNHCPRLAELQEATVGAQLQLPRSRRDLSRPGGAGCTLPQGAPALGNPRCCEREKQGVRAAWLAGKPAAGGKARWSEALKQRGLGLSALIYFFLKK